MKKKQKENIIISFLKGKERYKKLAEYFIKLIENDPSYPKESLHTITFRIKNESRLIEKIEKYNSGLEDNKNAISEKDYQSRISDILGLRIICLRLSDIAIIKSYLAFFKEEQILDFISGPDPKRSFVLPINHEKSLPDGVNLAYSGYSSIHYIMKLGDRAEAHADLKELTFELQLRTILEEAWGEIDHKYRYTYSRVGVTLPEHIHAGFYNLSAYLQVAALQAEYLCRMTETYRSRKTDEKAARIQLAQNADLSGTKNSQVSTDIELAEIGKFLDNTLKVKLSSRTLNYIEKRIKEINSKGENYKPLYKMLTKNRISLFKKIFKNSIAEKPFENEYNKNIDVINLINFCIFYEFEGKRIAQEGLSTVLKWRKKRLSSQ